MQFFRGRILSGTSYKLISTEPILFNKKDIAYYFLGGIAYNVLKDIRVVAELFENKDWTLYKLKVEKEETGKVKESTAEILQENIAKWYKALRLFALVGLLSVLVYVGIRIIISSTGQEKAKYKKMIVDWIAAVCILFVLQYIMSFTMTMVDEIIGIFKSNIIGQNGEDILMTSIRQRVGDSNTYTAIFTDLILYLVLVIYTVIFTIHYLKRLVYLAFFTIIAPLIALTYPLDKIKDGQAQAFGMWIKEYVFNALIPVMHIILYSIFVGSAMDFAQKNPLYALVCIGFLIPAEKFVRKMFGFDKATTSSQLGAAAGGAMVMNAINKIGNAPKGDDGPNKEKPVKMTGTGGDFHWNGPTGTAPGTVAGAGATTTVAPVAGAATTAAPGAGAATTAAPGAGATTTAARGAGATTTAAPGAGATTTAATGAGATTTAAPGATTRTARGAGATTTAAPGAGAIPVTAPGSQTIYGQTINPVKEHNKPGIGAGIKEAFGERFNRGTIKGFAKKVGKKVYRGAGKALGAAALGTFGLAAGIATGDLSKVAQFTGGAMLAGSKVGDKAAGKLAKAEKRTRDNIQKGRLGSDAYKEKMVVEDLRNNRDFVKACEAAGIKGKKAEEDIAKLFIQNGITDKEDIIKAMTARKEYEKAKGVNSRNRSNNPNAIANEELVAIAKANQGISDYAWGNPENRIRFAEDLYNKTGDIDSVNKVGSVISIMKGQ